MKPQEPRMDAQPDAARRRFTLAMAAAVCAPLAACGGGGGGGGDPAPGPAVQAWRTAGQLLAPRTGHSAIVLKSGRVLVMGGGGVSSEVYDPATGTSQPAGPMVRATNAFTATLLADGRVLVTGGSTSDPVPVAPPNAQLFDPASLTWKDAAAPAVGRSNHTATLLADGRVLVLGGNTTNFGEFYYPATDTWSPAPPMAQWRSGHTATLLRNGRVLVVGGLNGGDADTAAAVGAGTAMYIPTRRVELFDPATNTWSEAARLQTGRDGHTATLLLDGRVLVAGGTAKWDAPLPLFNTAEFFDPATNAWANAGVAVRRRFLHSAVLLADGRVLVAGGTTDLTDSGPSLPEVFQPATRTWTATSPMLQPRNNFALVSLADGTALALGGNTPSAALASVEAYR